MKKKINKKSMVQKRQDMLDKQTFWKCKCDCGNIITVSAYNLVNGIINSCGKCDLDEELGVK